MGSSRSDIDDCADGSAHLVQTMNIGTIETLIAANGMVISTINWYIDNANKSTIKLCILIFIKIISNTYKFFVKQGRGG